jgi:hypothetical protein
LDVTDYRYEWDLRLNDDVPMELHVDVGAGRADLKLGSLSLTRLDVAGGAGALTVDLTGAGQVRAWTTTKNPALRFLLIGLSFFLQNVWLHLRWLYTQVPRRGRRWLDTKRFTLARFARFIVSAVERRHGCIREITAPAVPMP